MSESSKRKIILGVDPGTRITGYGIILVEGQRYETLDYGCIRPPPTLPLEKRYEVIFKGITHLLEKYQPEALSVETQFVGKNVQSAMKLGMARGVILLAATLREIPVFEYAPTRAKQAVVGHGRASKEQVQGMVKSLLSLKEVPTPEDAADALAIAICHAHV